MLKENFLLDDFYMEGSSIDDFKKLISEIADKTAFDTINSTELSVMSYRHTDEAGNLCFLLFDPNQPLGSSANFPKDHAYKWIRVPRSRVLSKGKFEDLIKEGTDDVGVLLYDGVRVRFVSKKVLTTRLQPFGLNGDFLAEKSLARDALIANQFGTKALARTLVTREFNGITKVFSILGERYRHLPQSILVKIYEELTKGDLGKAECHHWDVTHFITGIRIEFPEKADEFQTVYGLADRLIPGIILETSDTGDCSVKVKGTWRRCGATSLQNEVSRKHIGNLSVEELLEEVDEKIFSEYVKLPEALCELMSQDITDASWNLESASGKAKNSKCIKNVLKSAFKQLKIVAAIGKQAEMKLLEQLHMEFDEGTAYTAYDIAVSLMSLPERVTGLHPLTQEKLQTAVGRAPYIKYNVKKEESAIILTA